MFKIVFKDKDSLDSIQTNSDGVRLARPITNMQQLLEVHMTHDFTKEPLFLHFSYPRTDGLFIIIRHYPEGTRYNDADVQYLAFSAFAKLPSELSMKEKGFEFLSHTYVTNSEIVSEPFWDEDYFDEDHNFLELGFQFVEVILPHIQNLQKYDDEKEELKLGKLPKHVGLTQIFPTKHLIIEHEFSDHGTSYDLRLKWRNKRQVQF